MLTHLRPLVCVPFVFRRSRLVLSVARFLLVQARVRTDEKGAFCKRWVISAHKMGATGQNYNRNSKSNSLRIRKIVANVDKKFSSCEKNRDHLRGHGRNLDTSKRGSNSQKRDEGNCETEIEFYAGRG